MRTGPIVMLEVAKQGAIYHGLATLLSQPSPVMTRGIGTKKNGRVCLKITRYSRKELLLHPSCLEIINREMDNAQQLKFR